MSKDDVLDKYKFERLSKANLYLGNLSKVVLYEADPHEVDLSGADLSGDDLSGTDLRLANLRGANLSGVNISRASLYGANLSGANLSGADLRWTNLRGANLTAANLSGADLATTYLAKSNLSRVVGLSSMEEEMRMLGLLREAMRQESFVFNMNQWHGENEESYPDQSSFREFLNTCGTIHCGAGFCQVKLAEEGNPIALTSTSIVGSYAIPSMAWLFASSKEWFIAYLDKLISGEEPLLQR